MRLLWWAPFLLILGTFGCRSVRPADVPGTWVIGDASRSSLPAALQRTSARIVFDSNGTFTALEMPALFEFPGRRPARLESGSGKWTVVSSEGEQRVRLEFLEIAGWDKNGLPYGTELRVSMHSSPIQLYYFVGDPDEGKRVAFEKR
jgi:hypothetical protein